MSGATGNDLDPLILCDDEEQPTAALSSNFTDDPPSFRETTEVSSSDEWTESESEPEVQQPKEPAAEVEEEEEEEYPWVARTRNEIPETPSLPLKAPPFQHVPPDIPMKLFGVGFSIVDHLLVIKTAVKHDPLDLDSLICLSDRTVLGTVFDTFGPVTCPDYSVILTTEMELYLKELKEREEQDHPGHSFTFDQFLPRLQFFYLPAFSSFVNIPALVKEKGSDASNIYDEEATDVEYSDDESEQAAKAAQRRPKKLKTPATAFPDYSSSLSSHLDYQPLRRPPISYE